MQRKGSQTQELTTICNGRYRRAGGGLSVPKPTTNYKILRRRIYTMKTLSKKILTVCLALMMAVVMALPTFAADYYGLVYRPFYSTSYSNNYLNVNRSSTSVPAAGRNLILYRTTSPGTDQRFNEVYVSVGGKSGHIIQFAAQPELAVNRSTSSGNAILYSWNSEVNLSDSAFELINRYDQPSYQLKYGNFAGQYLCYASDSPGARVYFSTSGYCIWDN